MSRMKQILVTVSIAIFIPNIAIADWRDNAKAIDISGGEDHTLVLTKDKTVWACGANGGYASWQYYYGVLGTGNNGPWDTNETLVRVHGPSDVNYIEDINDIDAGWMHSLALEKYNPNYNGYIWAWGSNGQGWGDGRKKGKFDKFFVDLGEVNLV